MSAIGLGLAALGRPGYLNLGHGDDLGGDRSVSALERHCDEVLDAAFAAGVPQFDAARSYGRAEEFLASWLESRGTPPGVLRISSKWGYTYTADWQVDADPPEVKDLSVHTLRRQLAETRSWLGPWLTLYQIHSATVSSGVLDDEDVLEELAFLREGGVEVGLTATGTDQARTIDLALERGGFDSVQATYNLLERSAGPALERAHAAGLRVMVKEAVANGRLTPRGGVAPLEAAAERLGVTSDAVALAFVLSRPWVDVVLSGASTTEQLRSNLKALDLEWSAELDDELADMAEQSERYWSTRSAMSWT